MASEPLPAALSAPESQPETENEKRLPIRTYHCRFCSHLLIASTRELLSANTPLRRRRVATTGSAIEGGSSGGVGGLDGALILELPSGRTTTRAQKKRKVVENDGTDVTSREAEGEAAGTAPQAAAAAAKDEEDKSGGRRRTEQAHYTIPLSTLLPDSTPVIIRREDGFEKRVLLRCGRCRVVVGYKLCDAAGGATAEGIDDDEDGVNEEEDDDDNTVGAKNGSKKDRAIYLLPGSIVGTEDLDVEGDGAGGDVLNAMIERNSVLKGMEGEWMEWVK